MTYTAQTAEFGYVCTACDLQEIINQLTEEEKEHRACGNSEMSACSSKQIEILYAARDSLMLLAAEQKQKKLASFFSFVSQPLYQQ